LNSKEYRNISVINRAHIIDDVFHFTVARKFNISMFWELTNYLLYQKTDYFTWYPMIKIIEYVSNMIPFSTHPISFTIMVKKFYLIKNIN